MFLYLGKFLRRQEQHQSSGIIPSDLSFNVIADNNKIYVVYWDLSFPSVVKAYFENICLVGLTFSYSDEGIPVSMCRAKKLYYVTTAGGTIADDAYGYGYVKALAQGMFGIDEVLLVKAENLDIYGSDMYKIMSEAKREIDRLFI